MRHRNRERQAFRSEGLLPYAAAGFIILLGVADAGLNLWYVTHGRVADVFGVILGSAFAAGGVFGALKVRNTLRARLSEV